MYLFLYLMNIPCTDLANIFDIEKCRRQLNFAVVF